MNKLSKTTRAHLIDLLVEGMSLRSVERVTGVSIKTVTKLLVAAGEACAAYHDEHVRNLRKTRRVQADEIWSFTYAKQAHVATAKKAPPEAGDTWTWLAMDADHKLVISWAIGPRDVGTAYGLMVDLAERLVNRVQMTTDGLASYVPAVEDVFGADVDFAQLIKLYGPGKDTDEGTTAARYSPPACHGARVQRVTGEPNPKHIATSYIERQNLTLRMANRRYTRLTNAFSKKLANHAAHVALHYTHYNFCRVHKTLRMSPAMAASVTETLRDSTWIVDLVDARAPEPRKPGPAKGTKYRPRRMPKTLVLSGA